jgi:hypothetical protein
MDHLTEPSSNIIILDDRRPAAPDDAGSPISYDDFVAHLPSHSYIFAPTGDFWPASGVNAKLKPILTGNSAIPAAKWLDENRAVEQMVWAPGQEQIIKNFIVADGGWIERKGLACFNLYRAPLVEVGDPNKASRWINHISTVYGPEDAEHIIDWLAFKVQNPQTKINHALVLGGNQGIGKDSLLEPIKYAVGHHNFVDIVPSMMMGRFNGYAKSVILRVSEARDLGDVDRYAFYDRSKIYAAAPPDVIRVDEKNIKEHAVFNVCGVIITSNYKSDGLYLPADDRRHFVCWSEKTKEDFKPLYWTGPWDWYGNGGIWDVVAHLFARDVSKFNPHAPPKKTDAFWAIVDANRAPEDAELADILDRLKSPPATTLDLIINLADASLGIWLRDRKNARQIPHRMEQCGYVKVRNDAAKDGLWRISERRQAVYVRRELSKRDQIKAARDLGAA